MTDRTLIITGGTGGLGTVVVNHLLRNYHCVVLFHSEGGFEALRTAAGPTNRLDGLRSDLASESAIQAALQHASERWGAPYGLVHLAGGFAAGRVSETSGETWNRMLDLNLTAAFMVIRETLARMDRDAAGRIVAISSAATLSRDHTTAAYTIAKSALNLLIELTARELKGSRITANVIAPNALDTPATRRDMPDAHLVPLDRVAETITFLLSDSGASVSGSVIALA